MANTDEALYNYQMSFILLSKYYLKLTNILLDIKGHMKKNLSQPCK